jgi:hypothetical protein
MLTFGGDQQADDPHDGLALFGPADQGGVLPNHVAIGRQAGLELWEKWIGFMNAPVSRSGSSAAMRTCMTT